MAEVYIIGLKELKRAIDRNPQKVLSETKDFLSRGLAVYKRGIFQSPWRIGGSGGGVPVKSGHLKDSHITQISGLEGRIGPDINRASYAPYVHFGTRKMQSRPWLDYVKNTKDGEIKILYQRLLQSIVSDLAK